MGLYVKFKRKANFCDFCSKAERYECESSEIHGGKDFETEVQNPLIREQPRVSRKSLVFETFFRFFSAKNSQRVVLRALHQIISLFASAKGLVFELDFVFRCIRAALRDFNREFL